SLNAMARVIDFDRVRDRRHYRYGVWIPVPDNFPDSHDIGSWEFWQDIETGARPVWTAKLKQLDDPAIGTAFKDPVGKYQMAASALHLTPPVFSQIDPGTPNKGDKKDGGKSDGGLNDLLKKLLREGAGTTPPPQLPDLGNGTKVTGPPGNHPGGGVG